MNCQTFRDQWHDRADGELSAADATALDLHAAGCDDCRRYDVQMRAVFAGLGRLRDRTVVAAPRRQRWYSLSAPRIAAAIALFVGATWLLSNAVRVGTPTNRTGEPVSANATGKEPAETTFTLTGESAKTYLALARPSSEPNVRMYWLYRVSEEQTQ
jgi:hypothetical protein